MMLGELAVLVNALISRDPKICFGKPHITGTRIKVSFILELLSSGLTIERILGEYDYLTSEQIAACLSFAEFAADTYRGDMTIDNEA